MAQLRVTPQENAGDRRRRGSGPETASCQHGSRELGHRNRRLEHFQQIRLQTSGGGVTLCRIGRDRAIDDPDERRGQVGPDVAEPPSRVSGVRRDQFLDRPSPTGNDPVTSYIRTPTA
jgi:hypothetical protein